MRLESELKCNFRVEERVTPSAEDILEESAEPSSSGVEECGFFNRQDFVGGDGMYKVAVKMLGKLTMEGFKDLRKEIMEQFKIPKKWLPSFATLTKNRPTMIAVECEPSLVTKINQGPPKEPSPNQSTVDFMKDMEDVGLDIDSYDINDTTWTSAPLIVKNPQVNISSFVRKEMSLKECHDELKATEINDTFHLAKIEGEYDKYVDILKTQHKKLGFDPFCHKRGILIDSYDGARHENTAKNETNIVSFSSKLVSQESLRNGYGGGSSLDILTWQQFRGDETARNVFPAIERILLTKERMSHDMVKKQDVDQFDMYELHDGKMIYLLTGHSLFNRKFHPFVLCECQRGEGLKEGHVCKLITHEKTIEMWDKSKRRWENKLSKLKEGEKYTKKSHMDFVDKHFLGISHFGIHPDYLRRDKIRFDVFHLRCAVTRRIIDYLRMFILRSSKEVIDAFTRVLESFFSRHIVLVVILLKPLSKLKGPELLSFIKNSNKIIDFLENTFEKTEEMKHLCEVIQLWLEITPFMLITYIDDVNDYKKKLVDWEQKLKLFYDVGAKTILTKNKANPGDNETFYLHVLRFYLPHIAKKTLEDHDLGLGIFTMQGFERRNKESKNTLRRFSNKKGNVLPNNLRRLFDIFYYKQTAV